jgi:hypothetical protein
MAVPVAFPLNCFEPSGCEFTNGEESDNSGYFAASSLTSRPRPATFAKLLSNPREGGREGGRLHGSSATAFDRTAALFPSKTIHYFPFQLAPRWLVVKVSAQLQMKIRY